MTSDDPRCQVFVPRRETAMELGLKRGNPRVDWSHDEGASLDCFIG
jgi:hypothetical protein